MAAVFETPGRGQRQLADQMGVDVVSFGQMIDLLEQRHLVKRELDPDDRRARRLYVTKRGVDLRSRLRPVLLAAQDRLLAPLSKSERTALLDMLVRVIEANEAYARPGNGRRKPRRKSRSPIENVGGNGD
jgi:DNA-binding MarR family transcriptional regulator